MRGNSIFKCFITFIFILICNTILNAQSIVVSGSGSYIIKNDGTLWACGSNESGALGDNSGSNQSKFVQIGSDTNWRKISAFGTKVYAIKKDGTLWQWGFNDNQQVYVQPTQFGRENNWLDISLSPLMSTYAIKTDGTLWAWGNNGFNDGSNEKGFLGDSTLPNSISVPSRIGSDTNWVKIFTTVSNNFAIKNDGTLWGWGYNNANELLTGKKEKIKRPIKIGNDKDWKKVSSQGFNGGNCTVLGLKINGSLWGFGNNNSFINSDTINYKLYSPIRIGKDTNWSDIGDFGSILLNKDGSIWTINPIWCNTLLSSISPIKYNIGSNWVGISASTNNYLVLNASGFLYSWGRNDFGQLGIGVSGNKYTPFKIGTNNEWTSVSAGFYGTVAIKNDSTLWAWGDNFGSKVPKVISSQKIWKNIITGDGFGFALKYDSTLWAWGANSNGIIGDSTKSNKTILVKVLKLGKVVDFSASRNHVAVIDNFGKLWSWGNNTSGQLGGGDKLDRIIPTQVGIDSNWQKVAINTDYSIAIKKDGTLWHWGKDLINKLDSINDSPVKISDSNWKYLSAGVEHALLINNKGSYMLLVVISQVLLE